jgi:hypothetical protein
MADLITKVLAGFLLATAAFWIAWTDLTITDKWTEGQTNLLLSYKKRGDVLMAQDKLNDALQAYRNGLAIAKLLAEAGPSDNRWRSELIVLRAKMADVESAQGKAR